jgi:hypothetical protein
LMIRGGASHAESFTGERSKETSARASLNLALL